MKVFVDTSLLVAAFYPDHIHHQRSLDILSCHSRSEIGCASHSLAEVYATLTAMPGKKRVSGDEALLFLENLRERLTTITLTEDEYFLVAEEAAALGLLSGAIYDAIIGRCALKSGAKAIYTWNVNHFQRLGPMIAARLQTP